MDADALAQLAHWDMSPADATAAGIFFVPSARQIFEEMDDRPALVIPYYDITRQPVTFNRGAGFQPFGRLRYLGKDSQPSLSSFLPPRKSLRYTQPSHSGVHAYFWPGADWTQVVHNPTIPIVVTEGEAKAIRACREGFVTIGLGGVFAWADVTGDMLPELAAFLWEQRDVFVIFDSDAATNPNVLAAEARLAEEFQRKLRARCHIVRLPPQDDGSKNGLDDFLRTNGSGALADLMAQSPSMSQLDMKVLALNNEVAWIEAEGCVYDTTAKVFIKKDNFTNGSQFSSITHETVGAKARTSKSISVANVWLRHPHARRYSEILFRPGEGRVITGRRGRTALNIWEGFDAQPGDVQPFFDLTNHVFANAREHARLPLMLMIYKAQHPHEKVPLSIVMTGPEGAGKTMWGDCIREAFGIYGRSVQPDSLHTGFRPWLENTLLITVNEAEGSDMKKAAALLRGLISDLKQEMNDKFRPQRQLNHYASYIITANDRSVGSFRTGDRRNIVIGVPPAAGAGLYDRVLDWLDDGGPRALMHWMLNYDLQGWKPPRRAPDTAEKDMARREGMTLVQLLAERMRDSNDTIITQWLDSAVEWARQNEASNNPTLADAARQVLDTAGSFQIRPWYTPDELLVLFPNVAQTLLNSRFNQWTPSGQLSKELRDAGINYLVNTDDHRGFLWRNQIRQYLVISHFDDFDKPISQLDFERAMANWPTYGTLRKFRR